MELCEGPVENIHLPVYGPFSDTVLTSNTGKRGSDGIYNIDKCDLLLNDIEQNNELGISEELVAKHNYIGSGKPEKQLVVVEADTGGKRGGSRTDPIEVGPLQQ